MQFGMKGNGIVRTHAHTHPMSFWTFSVSGASFFIIENNVRRMELMLEPKPEALDPASMQVVRRSSHFEGQGIC